MEEIPPRKKVRKCEEEVHAKIVGNQGLKMTPNNQRKFAKNPVISSLVSDNSFIINFPKNMSKTVLLLNLKHVSGLIQKRYLSLAQCLLSNCVSDAVLTSFLL